MYTQEITVNNEVGLHARPATFFIQKANEFKSGIWVNHDFHKHSREMSPAQKCFCKFSPSM